MVNEYYTFIRVHYNDETAPKSSVYTSDNIDTAVSSWHSYMGTYMKDPKVKQLLGVCLDNKGMTIRCESYEANEE